MKRSQIAHPAWCDRADCGVWPYRDGSGHIEVFHRVELFGRRYGKKQYVGVGLSLYVLHAPDGTVSNRQADVFVDGLDHSGRIPPGDLPAVIAALQEAARMVGDTLRETPAGPPSSPAQVAQSAPAR